MNSPSSFFRRRIPSHFPFERIGRGGSTMPSTDPGEATAADASPTDDVSDDDDGAASAVRTYYWTQLGHLQARSQLLKRALMDRGLTLITSGSKVEDDERNRLHQTVDWECARATETFANECLLNFNPEPGTKMVAPIIPMDPNLLASYGGGDEDSKEAGKGTTDSGTNDGPIVSSGVMIPKGGYEWITLVDLNRMRREDRTKVDGLWHRKYAVLDSWFDSKSPYSFVRHAPMNVAIVSAVLDAPGSLLFALVFSFLVLAWCTMSIQATVIQFVLTRPVVWTNWPSWGRFLHAPLPLKMLIMDYAWKGIKTILRFALMHVRSALIDYECRAIEEYLPLTILDEDEDGGHADDPDAASGHLADDNDEVEDDETEEEEEDDEDDDDF